VAKALGYKPEGHGFETRLGEFFKCVRGNLHFCYFSCLPDALECFFIKAIVDSIVVHNDDYYRQVVSSA
jgi:hypothetical protein